jgi:hypothetical protein
MGKGLRLTHPFLLFGKKEEKRADITAVILVLSQVLEAIRVRDRLPVPD